MSVRGVLLVLNIVVLLGLAVYAVRALRGTPEPKEPENLTPFLDDEALESRRLERVLGWALVFAAIVAVSLPVYWLREPTRQSHSRDYFDEGAVERGERFYANSSMEAYDSATSLQCANCHGADGGGGAANAVFTPPGGGDAFQVAWRAPALNTVLLRFSADEVRQIITYGRPGTPMQAWGIAGGGPKNEQAVDDLVAFLASIQVSPADAQAQAETDLETARKAAAAQVAKAEDDVAAAEEALAAAEQALDDLPSDATDLQRRNAQAKVDAAEDDLDTAHEALDWAQDWAARRETVEDGQLLFELYCARCHTQGWSVFDPAEPGSTQVLGLAGGGGTLGFNLRDGQSVRRFGPSRAGRDAQIGFVKTGSDANKAYGIGGIGSGRMPGFGSMLTEDMIQAIVEYERFGLDQTDYTGSAATTTTTTGG